MSKMIKIEKKGKVFLVGAGPGDPELITVKGLRILRVADVVLYDELVSPLLFRETKAQTELIAVGKKAGRHTVCQDEINELLLSKVQTNDVVIRLKGGDPYVLGRGFEEALYLIKHGISVEIVPGVSSAVAVPAYAGIPLTHRGLASSVAIVAGHGKEGEFEIPFPDADTLVYLMCVANLKKIVSGIQEIKGSNTIPCAVIENGTTTKERVIVGTLANIVVRAREAELRPPAILIVGDVVALRDHISSEVSKCKVDTADWLGLALQDQVRQSSKDWFEGGLSELG